MTLNGTDCLFTYRFFLSKVVLWQFALIYSEDIIMAKQVHSAELMIPLCAYLASSRPMINNRPLICTIFLLFRVNKAKYFMLIDWHRKALFDPKGEIVFVLANSAG